MATVLEPRPRDRVDSVLKARLDRARQQVRAADLTVALFGLASLVLMFGLGVVLLDRWLELPAWARQVAFVGFAAGVAVYFVRVLLRPLVARINPYFAARQVERTIPGAKNSLINWLDLRDEPLAPTVRDAVARKAASDLDRADVDEAVRDRRQTWWGIATGFLFVAAIVILCLLRPAQFFSLVSRAFTPFASTPIANQTEIHVLEPVNGDVTVAIHHPVDIRVAVDGRVPKAEEVDALRLMLRYSPDDPAWEERRLDATDRAVEWFVRVPSAQVRNGFEYKVVGGDATTSVYQVKVRAKPLITDFEVLYRYRPYLRFSDDKRADPNLRAVRGTEVTLCAKTNRQVRSGTLRFTPTGPGGAEKIISADVAADRPDTLKFGLKLEQSGSYRLKFVSADGEPADETMPYEVRVTSDLAPQLDLTKPSADKVAVNGTLTLAARATDDFGLVAARLTLKLKATADGPAEPLPTLNYRTAAAFKLADGTAARTLDLKEVIALDELKDVIGGKLALKPGMVLVCQWEADDNCDFPDKQTGKSKEQLVTLIDPQSEPDRNDAKDAAKNDKTEHDQKQDQDNQQKTDGGNGQQPPKDPNAKDEPGEKGQPGDKKEPGEDETKPMNPDEQKTLDQAKKINDALQKDQPQPPEKGNQPNKGNPGNKPDGEGNKQPNPANGENKPNPGAKPDGEGNKQPNPANGENKPNPATKPDGEGNKQPNPANGENKPNPTAKPDGQGDKQPNPGDPKDPNNAAKSGTGQDAAKTPAGNKPPENSAKQPGNDDPNMQKGQPKPPGQEQPGNRDNNNTTKPTQGERQPDKAKTGEKTTDTPDSKSGDKNDRTGEKHTNKGQKNDAPNDQKTNSSPDKGNAEGGEPGSQRAGEGPKDGQKMPKPEDKAISGKSDPDAKTDDKKPEGANSQGSKEPKDPGATRPDQGKANQPSAQKDPTNQAKPEDAAKSHAKPGEKATSQPKSEGKSSDGQKSGNEMPNDPGVKPQPNDKPNPGTPKSAQVQKLLDEFKKADAQKQKEVIEKLQQLAKSAKSPQERNEAQEGAQQCQGECDNPGQGAGKSQPSDQAKGTGTSANPGQKPDGQKPGGKSGDATAQKPDGDGNNTKPGDKSSAQAKASGEKDGKPGEKPGEANKANEGQKPKDHNDAKNDATGKAMAQGNRNGRGDVDGGVDTPAPPPNEKFLREAGDLQLETFKKKVDKKTLEQLKMTDAEYQQFLKAYEDLIKKSKQPDAKDAADRVRGAAKGGSAANAGAKKVEAGPKSGPKTDRKGAGQAPPEFRDQYKEFTEEQSKPKPNP